MIYRKFITGFAQISQLAMETSLEPSTAPLRP